MNYTKGPKFLRILGKAHYNGSVNIEIHHVGEGIEMLSLSNASTLIGKQMDEVFFQDWEDIRKPIEEAFRHKNEVVFDHQFQNLGKQFKIIIRPFLDELMEICFIEESSDKKSNPKILAHNEKLIALKKINSILINYNDPEDIFSVIRNIFINELNYKVCHFVFSYETFQNYSSIEVCDYMETNCLARVKRWRDIYINSGKNEKCSYCFTGKNSIKPCIIAPLVKFDTYYGSMILADVNLDFYDTDVLDFIREIAGNIASALYNHVLINQPGVVKSEMELYSKELSKRNKELEDTNVKLRKLNLELERAKHKSEESDRLKSAFLANMSHEIRTPLNGIIGFSQLLKNTESSDKTRINSFADVIMDSSNQLLKVINNIIIYSKIQADMADNVMLECNLNSELDNLFFELISLAKNTPEKELDLERSYDLDVNEDRILIDIVHLKEILNNLLDNAFKFTDKGKIELLYRVEKQHILFRIKDTGEGIPYEKKRIIFERFRQSDDSMTRKHGGIGLGLSIVAGLISIVKGQIWVQSKENEGTSFYFTIPYAIPKNNKKLTKKMDKLPDSTLKNMLNKKILVVEDDPASSEFVKVALEGLYNVHVADTGNKALEFLVENSNIDLVLLDIRLPDISGQKLVKRIKELFPNMPVVAQTANAMAKDKEKCLEAGCDAYLAKPLVLDKLLSTIKIYI